MSISFEPEEGYTVLLPETESVLLDPEKAREAIDRDRNIRRSHLHPLFDATARFACSFLIVPQGCKPFEMPRAPWITLIGDDLNFAWGPKAFPADSLNAAIKAAGQAVGITSGPDPYPYRVAATAAVKYRLNVLLIETLPHQKEAWEQHIRAVRGADDLPLAWCLAMPPEKGVA